MELEPLDSFKEQGSESWIFKQCSLLKILDKGIHPSVGSIYYGDCLIYARAR